ncbi:MAG: SDR family oxidoreductase [Leptotrichiaceae bacterium]|nr:SDR family oxidoreductase [Leptotrichiaceae bacterium]
MKIPFEMNMKDKVIVITGAGGILCSMFAKALSKTGAKIALLDLNEEAVKKYAEEIKKDNGIAKGYKCNVLDKKSIEKVRKEINTELGKCDILINGAGGNNPKATTDNEIFKSEDLGKMKTFFDLDKEGVEFVFNLNYMGTLLPVQVFAQDMIGRKGANILNISSMNAYTPLTKIPAYSGAKAAISNFTQWLAVHFSSVGIRCNAIAPGFFVSKQNEKLLFNDDGTPKERAEKILRNTPMNRFGKEEELLGALFFLINEEAASFVNGVIIPVDGGFSAYSGV